MPSASALENGERSPWDGTGESNTLSEKKKALWNYLYNNRVTPTALHVIDPREMAFDKDTGTKFEILDKGMDLRKKADIINDLVLSHSTDTCQAIMSLPQPPQQTDEERCTEFLDALRYLTGDIPPAALALNGERVSFISSGV